MNPNTARRAANCFRALLLIPLTMLLAACSSIKSHTAEYAGVRHYPPTEPHDVELLRQEPTRPHDRIGEISLDASTKPAPPIDKVEQRLREEGARLGADAVLVVYDRLQPTGLYVVGDYWSRNVSTVNEHVLIGLAIRYR